MTSMTRRALVRLAVLALPVAAVACVGGVDNPAIPQQLTVDSSGNGATGGGGNGAIAAVYKLSTFNGHTLPDTIVDDSTPTADPDSNRKVVAILDSAYLYLDTVFTVEETDWFDVIDQRSGTPAPTFSFSRGFGGDSVDCAQGTYNDTSATDTIFSITGLTCQTFGYTFPRLGATYLFSGDSLISTNVTYQYFDSAANATNGIWPQYSGTTTLTWDHFLPPTDQHGVSAPRGLQKGRRIAIRSH